MDRVSSSIIINVALSYQCLITITVFVFSYLSVDMFFNVGDTFTDLKAFK